MIAFTEDSSFVEMVNWCKSSVRGSLLYFSTDIRNSGFKIAPVDANFFPAGFNLLSKKSIDLSCSQIKKKYTGKKILLVIENHTRNKHYFQNVIVIKSILEAAQNDVRVANLSGNEVSSDNNIKIDKILRGGDRIATSHGFVPDVVIMNNDMISGKPEILVDIEQECTPPVSVGWFGRKKSVYFSHYDNIITKFCDKFRIDKWFFSTYLEECNEIDFHHRQGLENIASAVEGVLNKIKKKYDEYQITEKPYVFVKANNGSYGIGVIAIYHPDEILEMNKKIRNKMHATKGGIVVNSVIVQEGIKTIDLYNGHPAEVMAYSVLGENVAFIHRYNTQHSNHDNLNSKGMGFFDATAIHTKDIFQIVGTLAVIAAEQEAESAL